MKLDFTKVKVYDGISRASFRVVNIKEALADMIYKNSAGIAGLETARKIYNAESEADYDDKEVSIIREAASKCTSQFYDAINELISITD